MGAGLDCEACATCETAADLHNSFALRVVRMKPESKHTAIAVPQSTRRRPRRITLFILTSSKDGRSLEGLGSDVRLARQPGSTPCVIARLFQNLCSDLDHSFDVMAVIRGSRVGETWFLRPSLFTWDKTKV
jgi:hypothetical protein